MSSVYLWPDKPALSLLVLWLATQVLFYAARVPMHRALRKVGATLGGGMRIVARWLRSASDELRRRNREVLLEAGRLEAEGKLEREFQRLATTFTTDSPAAAKRPPRPNANSTGNSSSPVVPATAASSGDNRGTWYSSVNSASVMSQSRIFVSPERKKTCAMYSRAASRARGCNDSSAAMTRCEKEARRASAFM